MRWRKNLDTVLNILGMTCFYYFTLNYHSRYILKKKKTTSTKYFRYYRGNYDLEIQVEVAQGGTQAYGTYLQLEMLVL